MFRRWIHLIGLMIKEMKKHIVFANSLLSYCSVNDIASSTFSCIVFVNKCMVEFNICRGEYPTTD